MNTLTFDIETIPQQDSLSESQQEEFNKRIESNLKRKYPNKDSYTVSEYADLRGLTMATSPYLGTIVCICAKLDTETMSTDYKFVGKEETVLLDFWKLLKSFNGLFISFNGLNFDIPFILKRSMKYKIRPTNNSFLDLKRFSRFPHFDVRAVINDYDNYAAGNLDVVCDFLGIESPKNGEVKADNLEQAFLENKISEIAEYCMNDVYATKSVYTILNHYTFKPTR